MSEFFRNKSVRTVRSAKWHSNSYSADNAAETLGKRVLSSSYEPGTLGRSIMTGSEGGVFSVEKNLKLECTGNGIKTLAFSDSNDESSKENIESAACGSSVHLLTQDARRSSDKIIQEADYTSKSSYSLEQSPESLELDITTDEESVNGKLSRSSSFISRTRSSQAYGRSLSYSDREQRDRLPQIRKASNSAVPQNHCTRFSTESFRNGDQARNFQSLHSLMDSEINEPSSIPKSKDAEQLVKFCYSERDEQVKILQEVDELKFELQRLFTKTPNGNEASAFSIKVTHFKGKVPQHRSSLIPLSGELGNPIYETSRPLNEKKVLQPKLERPLTVKRHSRPFLGGAPFVICCRCYMLLQLPADFLVSTKKIHKLRCGACSEVLNYTFRPKSRSSLQTTALKHQTGEDEGIPL